MVGWAALCDVSLPRYKHRKSQKSMLFIDFQWFLRKIKEFFNFFCAYILARTHRTELPNLPSCAEFFLFQMANFLILFGKIFE